MKDLGLNKKENMPSGAALLRVLDAIPYAIAWATIPGGNIQYCNAEFVRLFGYEAGYFLTMDQVVDCLYLHEQQREVARKQWLNFDPPRVSDMVVVTDVEIDVLTCSGSIRTVLHSGVIIPDSGLAVAVFKDFSSVASSQRELREIVYLDELTGLSNRRGLRERWKLETTADPTRNLAVLMLDLDDFKPINDAHGHFVGDAVLQAIATRLKAAVRQTDLVCRLGGDEFVILLVAPADAEQIGLVCDRIINSVTASITVDMLALKVGVSMGVCLYPHQAQDKREALQRADLALYQIKNSGAKGAWRWFNDELAIV